MPFDPTLSTATITLGPGAPPVPAVPVVDPAAPGVPGTLAGAATALARIESLLNELRALHLDTHLDAVLGLLSGLDAKVSEILRSPALAHDISAVEADAKHPLKALEGFFERR